MMSEYLEKCSVCKKSCQETFMGKCDTCFLDEQYYGHSILMYDPRDEFES